ncbi:hypothetical protein MNBD_GAMMA01-2261 [hydrothermal vent metagenome]|uniref:Uncharacterized protein n=1 Tax=hydrothermal vent metagenome TaxID=652676 RepID=A0A3B0VC92_9ZZZZ
MKKSILVLLIALLLVSMQAKAYIDPGSGSAIMSAIIGFFVAIGLAVKTYWYKIKGFFSGNKKTSEQQKDEAD